MPSESFLPSRRLDPTEDYLAARDKRVLIFHEGKECNLDVRLSFSVNNVIFNVIIAKSQTVDELPSAGGGGDRG